MRLTTEDRKRHCAAVESKLSSLGVRYWLQGFPKVSWNPQQAVVEVRARVNLEMGESDRLCGMLGSGGLWCRLESLFHSVSGWKHVEDEHDGQERVACLPFAVVDRVPLAPSEEV